MSAFGVIGFGDVGKAIVEGVFEQRGTRTPVYCAGERNRPPYSPAFREKVDTAGGRLVDMPDELAAAATTLFSAVVPATALAAVGDFVPHLQPEHLFVDLNSCSPRTKESMAETVTARGATFADAALVGSPRQLGIQMPFIASGDGAARFRDETAPLGMTVDVLDAPAGAAALLKMLRSILTKGIAALAIELLVTALRAGIPEEALRQSFEDLERRGLTARATWFARTTCIHAGRRAGEMDEVIATLAEYGVPSFTATATRSWLATVASLDLKEHFGGEPPADHLTAIRAIEARLGSRSRHPEDV
ncbi:MAG: NAD(P)-dependent oxidoreductase [Chloroflexi bacterium]|nr:NAD(P)-dependent oxidoreductase [Chloroflexota bacterium]